MQLTTETLAILQNFAMINPNIVVEENTGKLKTVSEAKNIMAMADISEQIDSTFGIYDLNEFLSAIKLINKPMFTFDGTMIAVDSSSGTQGLNYFCSNPEILTYPKKDIKDPEYEVTLKMDEGMLAQIKKAASVLHCETVSLTKQADADSIWAVVSDPTNKSSNAYRAEVATDEAFASLPAFSFDILIGNMKIVPGDYTLQLSSRSISKWGLDSTSPITYWIALEKSSEYNA